MGGTESIILVHDGGGVRPAEEATVPVLDHGFLFGDSVYEVVRTARGRPFMLREHMERMRRSAAMIYMEIAWTDGEVAGRLRQLQEALPRGECYFRIVATRGPGPLTLLPDECRTPGLYLIGRPLMVFPARMYREGCDLAVVPRLRNDPRAMDPAAKTGNYLNNMLGLIESKRAGADDAIFLNADGNVTESTTSNVWIVEKGRVLTPPLHEGLLAGITRDWLFRQEGFPVEEAVIPRDRLDRADEVFLSGTVKGIMPARRVDGAPVGSGAPGPVARRLMALYEESLASN